MVVKCEHYPYTNLVDGNGPYQVAAQQSQIRHVKHSTYTNSNHSLSHKEAIDSTTALLSAELTLASHNQQNCIC